MAYLLGDTILFLWNTPMQRFHWQEQQMVQLNSSISFRVWTAWKAIGKIKHDKQGFNPFRSQHCSEHWIQASWPHLISGQPEMAESNSMSNYTSTHNQSNIVYMSIVTVRWLQKKGFQFSWLAQEKWSILLMILLVNGQEKWSALSKKTKLPDK